MRPGREGLACIGTQILFLLAASALAVLGLPPAPARAQGVGAPVTVYVPGMRRNVTAPLGIQFAAGPISDLRTAELPTSSAGLLAPILELDQFVPLVTVSFSGHNGYRLFGMSNEFAQGYEWYGAYVNKRMLIYALDGYAVRNTGGSDMASWANYFFARPQLFGGSAPNYMYIEYYLIERATAASTKVLTDSAGTMRRFAKIIPLAGPSAALRQRRAEARAQARDAAEARFTTGAARAIAAIVGVVVVGGILNDLSRPIGAELRADRERCERYRAQAGAVIVC